MCLPDICNPMKLCQFGCTIVCILILLVVGGYVGKGIYIQDNNPNETTYSMIRDSSFYAPDFIFWVAGISFVVALFGLLAILQIILSLMFKGMKRFFLWVICFPCCENDTDLDYTGIDMVD